ATICQLLHGMTVGGAEILADRLARRLAGRFRFIFACLDAQGELGELLQRDGFPVHVLGRGAGLDWQCARRLRRLFRAERVDLVHCHQYTPFFYAMLSRLGGRRPCVLFTEHGRFYPDYPRPKRILFNRLMLRRSDRAVAVGESVRQALISNEGLPPGRVDVIYNGIDLSRFEESNQSRSSAMRAELELNDADFVVVQVARLDSIKDH